MPLRITTLQNNLYFERVRVLRHTLLFFFFTDFEKKNRLFCNLKNKKIIREYAFEQKEKKPGLNLTLG